MVKLVNCGDLHFFTLSIAAELVTSFSQLGLLKRLMKHRTTASTACVHDRTVRNTRLTVHSPRLRQQVILTDDIAHKCIIQWTTSVIWFWQQIKSHLAIQVSVSLTVPCPLLHDLQIVTLASQRGCTSSNSSLTRPELFPNLVLLSFFIWNLVV